MADVGRDVFRENQDSKAEWIRLTNKARKLKESHRERETELETRMAAREKAASEHLALAEKTAGQLRHMSDMWAAANGKDANGQRVIDFDQVDEAFRLNSGGMTIDEYARMRARRGVSNPELARERAERRRLELELQRTKTNGEATPAGANGAGGTAKPSAPEPAAVTTPAPAAVPGRHEKPEEFWGDELPADHPIRQFAGWGKLVDNAMLQFHDETLDEYSRDAEEIADGIVQQKLAALRGDDGDDEPAPVKVTTHTRARPKTPKNRGERRAAAEGAEPTNVPGIGIPAKKLVPRGSVNTDRSHKEGHYTGDVPPGAMSISKAVERAQMRARGIDPDTGKAMGA